MPALRKLCVKPLYILEVKLEEQDCEVVVQRCSVKKVYLKFREIHRKTPVPESLFKTLLKKRLWHRCFPMNFVKFSKKTFFNKAPLVDASNLRGNEKTEVVFLIISILRKEIKIYGFAVFYFISIFLIFFGIFIIT